MGAVNPLKNYVVRGADLQAIGAAIRNKDPSVTGNLSFPSGVTSAISNMATGPKDYLSLGDIYPKIIPIEGQYFSSRDNFDFIDFYNIAQYGSLQCDLHLEGTSYESLPTVYAFDTSSSSTWRITAPNVNSLSLYIDPYRSTWEYYYPCMIYFDTPAMTSLEVGVSDDIELYFSNGVNNIENISSLYGDYNFFIDNSVNDLRKLRNISGFNVCFNYGDTLFLPNLESITDYGGVTSGSSDGPGSIYPNHLSEMRLPSLSVCSDNAFQHCDLNSTMEMYFYAEDDEGNLYGRTESDVRNMNDSAGGSWFGLHNYNSGTFTFHCLDDSGEPTSFTVEL